MNGLSEKEVIANREKYGTNIINIGKHNTFFKLFLESLGDPIIKILLIALGIKTIFLIKDFDWYETIGIVIAIIIASLISTLSEYGSSKAFERLMEDENIKRVYIDKISLGTGRVTVGIDFEIDNSTEWLSGTL